MLLLGVGFPIIKKKTVDLSTSRNTSCYQRLYKRMIYDEKKNATALRLNETDAGIRKSTNSKWETESLESKIQRITN